MSDSYDHYYTAFNKEGDLKIIDFALESTNTSIPFVVLRTKNGIFIAAKRELCESLEIPHRRTIVKINENCWMAITGRVADVDQIIITTRDLANSAIETLGFEPTADILARILADNIQEYIMVTGIRALSFTAVIFGFDENAELWQTDTSSVLYPYFAIGLGQGNLKMNKYLEKNYNHDASDENALICVVKSLSESIGSDFSPNSIDVAILRKNEELKFFNVDETDILLQKISESD